MTHCEPDAPVTLSNWRRPPHSRWAFHNLHRLMPTAPIAHDPDHVWALPPAPPRPLDLRLAIEGFDNTALVILHRGQIAHESYRHGMTAADPHVLMSISKSVIGALVGISIARGELAETDLITDHLPELLPTAYQGARVRDALDMRVGLAFDEDYAARDGLFRAYRRAAHVMPDAQEARTAPDLRTFQSLLVARNGPHGGRFHYMSPLTDVLAWLLERSSGASLVQLLSERLLQPLGAQDPGYIALDRSGHPRAAGGLCLTARDLARFGHLMLCNGAREGTQIVPEAWVADIRAGGDPDAWRAGLFAALDPSLPITYRSQWYVRGGATPRIWGVGIHGQLLFVDFKRQLSIAWLNAEADTMGQRMTAHVFKTIDRIAEQFDAAA